jgi:hypothetical protein
MSFCSAPISPSPRLCVEPLRSHLTKRLRNAEYPLMVDNRDRSKAEELVSKGAEQAAGPAGLAAAADSHAGSYFFESSLRGLRASASQRQIPYLSERDVTNRGGWMII